MCKAMEDMRNQTLKEGMTEVALRMLAAGKYALEEIVNISGLPLEEVKQLKTDRNIQARQISQESKKWVPGYIYAYQQKVACISRTEPQKGIL